MRSRNDAIAAIKTALKARSQKTVYCDVLRDVFTRLTGLGTMGA